MCIVDARSEGAAVLRQAYGVVSLSSTATAFRFQTQPSPPTTLFPGTAAPVLRLAFPTICRLQPVALVPAQDIDQWPVILGSPGPDLATRDWLTSFRPANNAAVRWPFGIWQIAIWQGLAAQGAIQ